MKRASKGYSSENTSRYAGYRHAMVIETVHLQLVPCLPEYLLWLIAGDERFEERFGLPAADGLRAFVVSDEVSPAWLERLRASSMAADPWVHGFAVVHRESRSVIGTVGFKGPPDEGRDGRDRLRHRACV